MIEAIVEFDGFTLKASGATPHDVLADLTALRESEISGLIGNLRQGAEGREALGRVLGAKLVEETPAETPAEQPQEPAQEPAAPAPAPAPTPEAPAPQEAAQPPQARPSFRSQEQQALPPGVTIVPNAPVINGEPAWLIAPPGQPWRAFAHPKPMDEELKKLPTTDNPNDPRLAEGTARFWSFLR